MAGQGYDDIYGKVIYNQDLLDFRPLLAATTWDGHTDLGAWLHLHSLRGTGTVISVTPSGIAGSTTIDVATLHGTGMTQLSDLLQHGVV